MRLRVALSVVPLAMLVAGCWETDVDDNLRLENGTGEVVRVEYELSSGKRVLLLDSLDPGEVRVIRPSRDPEVDGEPNCTEVPLIVSQGGDEIERFEPPVCHGDGLMLTVDGEP